MTQGSNRINIQSVGADRARLEAVIADPETSPRDLASLGREYRQTITALAAVTPAAGTSKLDEIAARRRKRGA